MQKATFGAGCFWGVQAYFDKLEGVEKTTVGYTGGHAENPTYEGVCSHSTGHAEAIEIEFDEKQISYKELLSHFFKIHDPTQKNRQGHDVGDNYRSAIFYHGASQKKQAEEMVKELNASKKYPKQIATTLEKAAAFWPAESYHQKYYKTHSVSCHM